MIHLLFSDAPVVSADKGPQVPGEVKHINEEHALTQKQLLERRVLLLRDAQKLLSQLTVDASLAQNPSWSVDDEITLWFYELGDAWDYEDSSLYAAVRYLRGTSGGQKPPTPELTMMEVCYFPDWRLPLSS